MYALPAWFDPLKIKRAPPTRQRHVTFELRELPLSGIHANGELDARPIRENFRRSYHRD